MAAIPTSIKVEGLNRFARELKRAEQDMSETSDELKKINREVAEDVLGAALRRVPVRSGRLQGTLRATATARQGAVRAGFKSVPYAGPIHFGWPKHNIAPQPFLYDALDERKGEVENAYLARVRDLMDRTFPGP